MRPVCLVVVAVSLMLGQIPDDLPPNRPSRDAPENRLPNGKSQRDAIIKADHKKDLEDATRMVKLSQEVKDELESSDPFIVSVKTVKKLDDIDKLAKDIRNRLKRF